MEHRGGGEGWKNKGKAIIVTCSPPKASQLFYEHFNDAFFGVQTSVRDQVGK